MATATAGKASARTTAAAETTMAAVEITAEAKITAERRTTAAATVTAAVTTMAAVEITAVAGITAVAMMTTAAITERGETDEPVDHEAADRCLHLRGGLRRRNDACGGQSAGRCSPGGRERHRGRQWERRRDRDGPGGRILQRDVWAP